MLLIEFKGDNFISIIAFDIYPKKENYFRMDKVVHDKVRFYFNIKIEIVNVTNFKIIFFLILINIK